MDAETYAEAIEYELLTQLIYKAILQKEGVTNVEVKHNVSIAGRSGVEHQVDVYWEFKQAGVSHRVLIECKNYASSLTLEKARNFFAVLHDIGNCNGIMVTKTGYQSGTAAFCKYYGINLKLLREPTEEDWKGRIKSVHLNLIPRVPVSTDTCPIVCDLYMQGVSEEQQPRLEKALSLKPDLFATDPSLRFLGPDAQPITDELRWWLPKQLKVLDLADGGPYTHTVKLDDHYLSANLGAGNELVKAIGVKITFYVETLASERLVIDVANTVSSILKDFETGAWEHVQKKT